MNAPANRFAAVESPGAALMRHLAHHSDSTPRLDAPAKPPHRARTTAHDSSQQKLNHNQSHARAPEPGGTIARTREPPPLGG
ncbi:hypothetical protein GCM10009654_13520 [Streptomyces hebeiensis]|uniref:Uncharacterized protein n=1 Tax=Streptomyces hebeiensis TaxID=229486 RepID=A0ABN1UMJ6_9ACTN